MSMNVPGEYYIQCHIAEYVRTAYPRLFHTATMGGVPLGDMTTKKGRIIAAIRMKKMKKAGYVSGIPDMIFFGTKVQGILFLEVKQPGEKPSPDESVWIETMRFNGNRAEVVDNVFDASRILNEYMAGYR